MEILEKGDLDKFAERVYSEVNKPKTFLCHACGCKFKGTKQDYSWKFLKFGFYCACPTCGRSVREYDELAWY